MGSVVAGMATAALSAAARGELQAAEPAIASMLQLFAVVTLGLVAYGVTQGGDRRGV